MAAKLVSMKMTKAEREEKYSTQPSEVDAPVYPYGLEVRLDEDALEKLDLTKLPAVGGELMLLAKVSVTGVSDNAHARGGEAPHRHRNVTLQITELCLEGLSKDEDKVAERLYNGNAQE